MASFARRSLDLTQVAGNPAQIIQERYQELMAITDVKVLAKTATDIILTSEHISERNAEKFVLNMRRAVEKGLREVQKFITNWLLAASNNRVLGVGAA